MTMNAVKPNAIARHLGRLMPEWQWRTWTRSEVAKTGKHKPSLAMVEGRLTNRFVELQSDGDVWLGYSGQDGTKVRAIETLKAKPAVIADEVMAFAWAEGLL